MTILLIFVLVMKLTAINKEQNMNKRGRVFPGNFYIKMK